jgi:hypothetical protein
VETTSGARLTGWARRLARAGRRSADELDSAALNLVADAGAAARLRGYQRDPNVAALGVERTRDWLDRWGWILLFSGLAFTTVNVAMFVGGWTGWLVEPHVMRAMLVLLRGEQVANRFGEASGRWVRTTRWAALMITYVMNTGAAYAAGDLKQIFIHSVPVILVAALAEALVQQRQTLTLVAAKVGLETSPEIPQERSEDEAEGADTEDELVDHRLPVEKARDMFFELAARAESEGVPIESIRPADVDRAARTDGAAKRTGRMEKWRNEYREWKEGVTDGDSNGGPGSDGEADGVGTA